jgi:hypothetical protein
MTQTWVSSWYYRQQLSGLLSCSLLGDKVGQGWRVRKFPLAGLSRDQPVGSDSVRERDLLIDLFNKYSSSTYNVQGPAHVDGAEQLRQAVGGKG